MKKILIVSILRLNDQLVLFIPKSEIDPIPINGIYDDFSEIIRDVIHDSIFTCNSIIEGIRETKFWLKINGYSLTCFIDCRSITI